MLPRLLLTLFLATLPAASAQTLPTAPSSTHQADVPPDEADMTPDQKARFTEAGQSFNASRFPEALALFRKLYEERPADANLAKFTAESAINTGDTALAITTLRPLELRDPDDWQVVSILAHAYAQSGQKGPRDVAMARLQTLHDSLGPPFSTRRDYLLESVPAGDKRVTFFPALTPWGPFHVHLIARVYSVSGDQTVRITLETPDFDQSAFAREHPEQAAKGVRRFSLDGYAPDQRTANGQIIQTHSTYLFYDGQPTYDTVREDTLAIVTGKRKAISSTTTPIQQ